MNSDYRAPVDIGNRALTHCGARRITSLADSNDRASEVAFVYDKLRTAELRRNVWTFATRKAFLRQVVTTTMLVTFPAYSSVVSYPKFFPVTSDAGRIYQAQSLLAIGVEIDDNTAGSQWTRYFGTDVAFVYDADTSWSRGELVYDPDTGDVYLSLTDDSDADPTAGPPAWDATITYRKGDTVTQGGSDYQSDADLNLNNTPGVTGWTLLSTVTAAGQLGYRVGQDWLFLDTATVSSLEFAYPLADGPAYSFSGNNVFRLPVGFLRQAPLDPKAGSTSWLGADWNLFYDNWKFENGYIISANGGAPILLRFVADVSDVVTFDPMFCELLGARIGLEIVERLTQATGKKQDIASMYKQFGSEARTVNGIEAGPTEPPMDDYIAARF